jgi:hypothetical protein
MASGSSDRDALSKLLQMGTVADYQSEFVVLVNRVTRISESLLVSFYISGLKLDLQCLLLRSNLKTLDEAFSLTRAAETGFTNLDIWEFLRSNPLTLGENFFKAHITEGRFETIAKEEKEHIVEKKIDVILPLKGEFASPKAEGSLNANEYIGIEEVVGGGEALKVGEDELNRVISILKDGGGEFDSRLDEKVENVMAWVAKDGRMVLCYVQGKGIRKKKKAKYAIQKRLWDPGLRQSCRRTDCPNDSRSPNVWHKDCHIIYLYLRVFV